MKHATIAALIFILSVAHAQAQQQPVNLSFSGTAEDMALLLQPSTVTSEQNFSGNGSLGPFTYHEVLAESTAAAASSTCTGPTRFFVPILAGSGVFRFQDGSLLTVRIEEGGVCVDLAIPLGHVTVTYQITGGTERFKDASGTLKLTAASKPLLFNTSNEAVFFAATGEFTGKVAF
jgi:hypothetical protein